MKENDIINARLRMLMDEIAYLKSERDKIRRFDEYRDNIRLKKAVERSLQVAIEICHDISQRLISERGFRLVDTYRESFEVLEEEGVLSPELGREMKKMAGFRNLIVHDYARIDDTLVYGILKRHLQDFEHFADAVERYLGIQDAGKEKRG